MTRFKAEAVREHIVRNHPGCPDFAVDHIVRLIVSRRWKNARIGKAVGITMQNLLRHEMTDYDTLLLTGVDRAEAKRRVQPRVDAMLKIWSRARP